jgi:thymidine kinase
MAWADEVKEIKTICHCGKKAIMNARVNEDGVMETAGAQIEIGGNERYVSLCRSCFAKGETGQGVIE